MGTRFLRTLANSSGNDRTPNGVRGILDTLPGCDPHCVYDFQGYAKDAYLLANFPAPLRGALEQILQPKLHDSSRTGRLDSPELWQ